MATATGSLAGLSASARRRCCWGRCSGQPSAAHSCYDEQPLLQPWWPPPRWSATGSSPRWCSAHAQVSLLADGSPAEDLPFVVPRRPLPARGHRLRAGTGRPRSVAATSLTPPDAGIVASLDELAGPDFDPAAADPKVREFYEHTTRFRLDIVPEWRLWVRPGYLLYRKSWPAPRSGQRPDEPAGDPARHPQSDRHHHPAGSSRPSPSAAGSGRSPTPTNPSTSASTPPTGTNDRGYVSVGFPVPQGSFTATLLPRPDLAAAWC